MSKKFYLISLLFYFCALFMSAQNSLRLSPIFASGMVLQQNADVIFWLRKSSSPTHLSYAQQYR